MKTPNQYLILASTHLRKDDLDGTIDACEKAININKNHVKAHYYMANACFRKALKKTELVPGEKKGYHIKARKHFEEVLNLDPESQEAKKVRKLLLNLKTKFG